MAISAIRSGTTISWEIRPTVGVNECQNVGSFGPTSHDRGRHTGTAPFGPRRAAVGEECNVFLLCDLDEPRRAALIRDRGLRQVSRHSGGRNLLRGWSDCGGDVETVFGREDLLTWVTAYWVTGVIGTSFTPYVEPRGPVEPVEVPAVVTAFPGDLVSAPRSYGERLFDIREWIEHDSGGHFAAWEKPELFVAGVRSAIGAQAR